MTPRRRVKSGKYKDLQAFKEFLGNPEAQDFYSNLIALPEAKEKQSNTDNEENKHESNIDYIDI